MYNVISYFFLNELNDANIPFLAGGGGGGGGTTTFLPINPLKLACCLYTPCQFGVKADATAMRQAITIMENIMFGVWSIFVYGGTFVNGNFRWPTMNVLPSFQAPSAILARQNHREKKGGKGFRLPRLRVNILITRISGQ